MAMNPKLSVVIVSWNCRQLLSGCLESVVRQLPAERSEIIVVDNASSDGTVDAVRAEFPAVKVIESGGNLGFARGNNIGLEACTGEYIFLINPDVVVGEHCIGGMVEYMESHPDVGMLGPQIVGVDGLVQRSCMRTPTLWNQFCRATGVDTLTQRSRLFGGYLMKDFGHDALRDVDIINGCFWMVRRTALNVVGPMDPRYWMYADDLDWCLRFHRSGWRVVFFPEAKAVHFGGGSSENAPVFCYVEMQRADLQYWRKYHGMISYGCYFAILYLGHAVRSAAYAAKYAVQASGRSQALLKVKKHFACIRWLMSRDNRGRVASTQGV
jgi:hypothetical protein